MVLWRLTWPQVSGMLRQPSSSSAISSEAWMIWGFAIGIMTSFFSVGLSLQMMRRMLRPTCGAARPIPFSASMVLIMSRVKERSSPVIARTGFDFVRRVLFSVPVSTLRVIFGILVRLL